MKTLEEFFYNHPLEFHFRDNKKQKILYTFSSWVNEYKFNDWHYSLFYMSNESPLCYHNNDVISLSLDYLRSNYEISLQAIYSLQKDINHAVISIIQPTSSWDEAKTPSLNTPDKSAAYESIWHPEYQRYTEHIFNHLINIYLFIIGKIKNKDYLSQDLANRSKIIADNISPLLTTGYDSIIRNAISHGSTEYEMMTVKYIDKKSDILLMPSEFAEQFDKLVDTCHSLLSAILLFISENKCNKYPPKMEMLPFGIRLLLSAGIVYHPGLQIITMLETQNRKQSKQLHVVCRVNNPSKASHQFDSLYIAWTMANLYKHYDRILISIDCGKKIYSLIAFDGKVLNTAIEQKLPIEKCEGLIQSSLLWYDASHIRSWFSTFHSIVKTTWPKITSEIRSNIEKAGLVKPIYKYSISTIENNSLDTEPRIICYAILDEKGKVIDTIVISTIQKIILNLRNKRVKRKDIYGEKGIPSSPAHILIRLSSEKRRIRSLKMQSWQNEELILIAEWKNRHSKTKPSYTKNAHYIEKSLRIKFNPSIIGKKL